MSTFVLCVGCGAPLYGFSPCQWCTCERCGNDLRDGFCSLCNSRNSLVYDPNPNSFDCPPDSCHPPHPTYETYSGDSCRNVSHPSYDCPPQNRLIMSQNWPTFKTILLIHMIHRVSHNNIFVVITAEILMRLLSFDQTQPPQFPVIHPPPQETSNENLHDHENVINYVQTFLRKFNHYSFFETPKVLLLAWDRVFEIKDAFGNKQYKPEDMQELFHKLLNDVQHIYEELAEYINTLGWNRPAFYDDDDDVDYTITITPVLSTEEPVDFLSMGDEHLDTIPATESDEVIKYSVEDLVPIPSESEGIPDTINDDSLYNANIEYVKASPHDSELVSLEVAEIVIPEEEEIEDDNLHEKLLNVYLLIANIEALKDNPTLSSEFLTNSGSTTTHSNISLPDYEAFHFDDNHIEEISSGSTTTHSDVSLSEYDSFIFDLPNDQFPPTDRSDFTHEEFVDELAHIISPPEYDCFYFRNLPDPSELISILNSRIRENLSSTTRVNLTVEDNHSPLLAYVVWIFLDYLTYPIIPPYLHSFGNEDTIF
nr:pre-mRNA splicing Prp18-interacting factor [Tanacetum cinerariifolium]